VRITLLAPLIAPLRSSQAGGAEAVLCDLARGLHRAGEAVELVAPRGSRVPGVPLRLGPTAAIPEARHRFGAPPRLAPGAPWPPPLAPAYLRLAAELAADREQVIHSHALDWPAFYATAATGLRCLHTLHLGPVDPATVAAAQAAAACRPRPRFAAVSRSCAAQWRPLIPVDAVVPNGVDPSEIRFVPRASADDLAVVAGRISPEKGTHLALAACRRAGMRVLMAGEVYDRHYFDERIAPRLDDDAVQWVGAVSRRRLGALLGRAAVAVVASVWEEPFGMVALEANLAGTPVAGFRRGALPEVVGRSGGVLADGVGVAALAAAITAARGCDRARARRAAETRFPLEAMVNAYRRLYRRLEQDG